MWFFYAFLRSQVHRHHFVFYSFLCYRSNSITIYTDLNWLMASHTHILYNMLGGGGSLFLGVLTFFLIIFWLIHITRMTVIGIKSRNFNQPYRRACYALFMYVLFIFISFHFTHTRTHSYRDRGGCSRYHHQHNLNIQTAKSF